LRIGVLVFATLAAPALGEAPKLAVAPAGVCAGEEPDLIVRLTDEDDDARMPISLLLTPSDVAAGTPSAGLPAPALPQFSGPGPCDDPGSGCRTRPILEVPDPGTGCGFPGSECE
jgi:hypothetical protein